MESECCVMVSQVLPSPALGSAPSGWTWSLGNQHLTFFFFLGPPRPGGFFSCQTCPEESL